MSGSSSISDAARKPIVSSIDPDWTAYDVAAASIRVRTCSASASRPASSNSADRFGLVASAQSRHSSSSALAPWTLPLIIADSHR